MNRCFLLMLVLLLGSCGRQAAELSVFPWTSCLDHPDIVSYKYLGVVGDEISSASAIDIAVSGWGPDAGNAAIGNLRESVAAIIRPGVHVIRLKWNLEGRKVVSHALADDESILYDNVATYYLRSCEHPAPEIVVSHGDAVDTDSRFIAADTLISVLGYPVACYKMNFLAEFNNEGTLCDSSSESVAFNAAGWVVNASVSPVSGDIGSDFQEIAWSCRFASPFVSSECSGSFVLRPDSESGPVGSSSDYDLCFPGELYMGHDSSFISCYYDHGALLIVLLLLVLALLVIRVRSRDDRDSFRQEKRELQVILDSDVMHDPYVREAILKRVMILDEIILSNSLDDQQRQQDAYDKAMALAEDRDAFLTSVAACLSVSRPGFVALLRDKGLTDWEIGYCGLYLYGLSSSDVGLFIRSKIYYRYNSSIRSKLGLSPRDTNLNIYLRELAEGADASAADKES